MSSKMMLRNEGATLLLLLAFCLHRNVQAQSSLKMVHLVYRHGIRSPVHFYKTDKFQEEDWVNGVGHLTQKGMQVEYELGKFLKYRYVRTNFINSSYLHKEVYVRSSGAPRCLQSALSQLAGLYPPQGYQVWNKDIAWQPVPVHTVQDNDDPLLRPFTRCPRLDEIRKTRENSAAYLADVASNQEFLDKVSARAGQQLDYDNLWWVTDSIHSEEAEGFLPLYPNWTDIRKPMFKLSDRIFGDRWKGDDEMGRITGGPLLARMIKHMKRWSNDDKTNAKGKQDLYKFNIYSGHDQSLLALACALNVSIDIPLFGAVIMVELHHTTADGWYVEIRYRNDKDYTTFTNLKLKKCAFKCPLDDFIKLTKNRVSVDRAAECKIPPSEDKIKYLTPLNLKILLGVFITLSLVFLTIIVILCYNKYSVGDGAYRHNVHDDGFDALEIAPDESS